VPVETGKTGNFFRLDRQLGPRQTLCSFSAVMDDLRREYRLIALMNRNKTVLNSAAWRANGGAILFLARIAVRFVLVTRIDYALCNP